MLLGIKVAPEGNEGNRYYYHTFIQDDEKSDSVAQNQ